MRLGCSRASERPIVMSAPPLQDSFDQLANIRIIMHESQELDALLYCEHILNLSERQVKFPDFFGCRLPQAFEQRE